jgi:hypothetical protein
MNTYLLTMPSDPTWINGNPLEGRLMSLQAICFHAVEHELCIIFSNESHAQLATRLFAGIKPHPKVRLALISNAVFLPK